jgi:t-SNARE complex subunit (syntaxin)
MAEERDGFDPGGDDGLTIGGRLLVRTFEHPTAEAERNARLFNGYETVDEAVAAARRTRIKDRRFWSVVGVVTLVALALLLIHG